MRVAALLLWMLAAPAAAAVPLDLPQGAQRTAQADVGTGAALPAGPWRAGEVPRRRFEGEVTRAAFALPAGQASVDAVAGPLVAQLRAAGYDIAFDCADAACGGYDFRFAVETLPAPAMFVDLADYRYVLATGPEGSAVALMVSRARDTAYVQVTRAGAAATMAAEAAAPALQGPSGPGDGDPWERLADTGHASLDDLLFPSGSASLGEGAYPSLEALAAGLAENPGARIVLVGHTDTAGGLSGNVALSRRRAEAVRAALIDDHGVAPGRVTAEGVGFLAPRASNGSEAGRRANRRVEAVLVE